MKYENIVEGIFLKRPNRFIANVLIDDEINKVHVPNTGRCREIFVPEIKVILTDHKDNPNRKTRYSLVSAYKGENLVNIDSQNPNLIAYEAIKNNKISQIGKVDLLKREKTYKDSRFDIYYEKNGKKGFVEVKGVTLEKDNIAMFPDAPTSRGAKHISGLIEAVKDGYESTILFVIQMENTVEFRPNYETDPEFSNILKQASLKGVNILAYDCKVTKDIVELRKEIPVIL